jgi:hypothetical protein
MAILHQIYVVDNGELKTGPDLPFEFLFQIEMETQILHAD